MIPRFPRSDELTPREKPCYLYLFALLLLGLAACSLPGATVPSASDLALTPSATAPPWIDANTVMSGLCFESVNDAAGRTFVIRSADELSHLYDLADNSKLCRHPVERSSFDFSGDRIIAGTWSRAKGCAAHHDVIGVQRDDQAHVLTVALRLVVEGVCNYELVRPFWIGLSDAKDYDVRITVQ